VVIDIGGSTVTLGTADDHMRGASSSGDRLTEQFARSDPLEGDERRLVTTSGRRSTISPPAFRRRVERHRHVGHDPLAGSLAAGLSDNSQIRHVASTPRRCGA
jgi:hypothetical protein